VKRPSLEIVESDPRSQGNALVRRERRASLRVFQMRFARRSSGAGLAWAVLGILAGVVVTLAGVVVALVCLLLNHPATETAPAPAAAVAATPATEQPPAQSAALPGDSILDCKGYILPVQRVLVSPKVGGMVVKLHIREGSRVKKGEVLAELEDVDYKADFLHAQAAVETAQQQLTEAETSQPKEIGKVRPGQRCKVRTEAYPDRIYDGIVSRLMPVADRRLSTISIRVKITVPQEDEGTYLKPEMIAVVSLLGNAAIARLDEAERASHHPPLPKPCPPTPSSTPHRPLPTNG
jgi:multidrug efflux pump subunit AcrA (membrane-fusion protein)